MSYQTILFDIDGTLLDPGDSIIESARYALSKFDIQNQTIEDLRKFVGPPLEHSFKDYYGFTDEQIQKAVGYFRDKLTNDGIDLYKPYNHMPELVRDLTYAGKQIGIVTSKIDTIATSVLKHTSLFNYFQIICAQHTSKVVHKDEILGSALEKFAVTDKASVIMIGDRKHDIEAAKTHGIDSIGILHGYGDRAELVEAGATYIVKDADSIHRLLL